MRARHQGCGERPSAVLRSQRKSASVFCETLSLLTHQPTLEQSCYTVPLEPKYELVVVRRMHLKQQRLQGLQDPHTPLSRKATYLGVRLSLQPAHDAAGHPTYQNYHLAGMMSFGLHAFLELPDPPILPDCHCLTALGLPALLLALAPSKSSIEEPCTHSSSHAVIQSPITLSCRLAVIHTPASRFARELVV